MGGGRRSSGPSGLSPEDAALWDYVARKVKPTRGKPIVQGPRAVTGPPPHIAPPLPPSDSGRSAPPPPPPPKHRPEPVSPRPAEPVRPVVLERKKARRIARGAHEIEATLDLHGLTQDEAHRALNVFIRRSQSAGLRTVLVITGKGGPGVSSAHEHHPFRERGVLRRMVPHWLDSPDLRPLVISWSAAHIRHGGGGALYVMLRRSG